MIMKLFFLARFDLELKLYDNSTYVKSGDIVYLDEIPKVEIFVKSRANNFESYSLSFDGCLNNEYSYAVLRKIKNDIYLIELKPKYIFLPAEIQKRVINFDNDLYLVEMHNSKLIQIHTPKEKFILNRKDFIEFNFEIKTVGKKLLFLRFKFKDGDYYYIFNSEKLIFNGLVKELNIQGTHLILLYDDISCYGQKRVVDFDLKEGKEEKYFVYGDERIVCKDVSSLYLFLDAVKIKNYALCEQYLSKDLCGLDENSFFEFFEDFDNYMFIENECVLEKNNEVIKVIHFEVLNNVITNIYD